MYLSLGCSIPVCQARDRFESRTEKVHSEGQSALKKGENFKILDLLLSVIIFQYLVSNMHSEIRLQ